MNTIPTTIEHAREQLNEILTDPQFGRKAQDGTGANDIWQQLVQPFFQWIEHLPRELLWGTYIFLGVFFSVIIGWFLRDWWKKRQEQLTRQVDPMNTEKHYLDQARAFAEQGQYREAIRTLFMYVLQFTAMKRKIFLQIDKTNGELLSEVRRTWPIQAQPYAALSHHFDEVWYGEKQIVEDEFQQYQQQVVQFMEKGDLENEPS